jgi:hypothetical protein
MTKLKALLYTLPATLVASSFLNSANAFLIDLETTEPKAIPIPQNIAKSSSKIDLLWKFWDNDNALLTLFKLDKLKVFMKRHPEFQTPANKEYISHISYDAHVAGHFSFLIKKRNENVKCENSKFPGKILEMRIGADSESDVKEFANAFILKVCPNEDPVNGLTVSAEITLDSNQSSKPWYVTPKGQALDGITGEIKDSIEKKLPRNLPLFLNGQLQDVQGKPVLSVNVQDIMKTECPNCDKNSASNQSLKNISEISTSSSSKGNLATSGK